MVEYHFRVRMGVEDIPFREAVHLGLLEITEQGFAVRKSAKVEQSSALTDAAGREIYDQDILVRPRDGRRFLVAQTAGCFFLRDVQDGRGGALVLLCGLCMENRIDDMYVE